MNDLSYKDYFREKYSNVFLKMQSGLIYPASTAIFITINFDTNKYNKSLDFLKLNRKLKKVLVSNYRNISKKSKFKMVIVRPSLTLGVGMSHWGQHCTAKSLPKGFEFNKPTDESKYHSKVLENTVNYTDSKADIWMHVKFNGNGEDEPANEIYQALLKEIPSELMCNAKIIYQIAHSKSNSFDGYQGKVLGCRFLENINNPTDPIGIAKHTLIGIEGNDSFGGSYVLAQRFKLNWNKINQLSEEEINYVIGRNSDSTILPDADSFSHIKSSRLQGEDGLTTQVYRLGLPFGRANSNINQEITRGINSIPLSNSAEEGVYFAGYAKSASVLESIVANQRGSEIGFTQDKLISMASSDVGGIYYIPSRIELKKLSGEEIKKESNYHFLTTETGIFNKNDKLSEEMTSKVSNIKSLPKEFIDSNTQIFDIDWSRMDRHFRENSDSEYMVYNSKDFLFKRSIEKMPDGVEPISLRILALLSNSFSSWQDNWYYDRKQEEMHSMEEYFFGTENGIPKSNLLIDNTLQRKCDLIKEELKLTSDNLYNTSIMLRKGLAIRLQLNLLASDIYGFKGRRIYTDITKNEWIPYNRQNYQLDKNPSDKLITGADTFRIYPEEIIVGCMPNLTLGEGSYLIKYLNTEERHKANLIGISEASGVGHVIPDFQKILSEGLGGSIDELRVNKGSYPNQEMVNSSIQALLGIQEYISAYEFLAKSMSDDINIPLLERNNLTEIATRLNRIKDKPASSFVEAVQLVYFIHLALHHTGEPTALGRLDQILEPYLKETPLDEALEIMDAFFIKLDEKVQQNRIMMEDHQYYGNMAMGGSSGPYPQGASLGQWIQQLTIGGCEADDNESVNKPSFNNVTRLVLKSIGRLPLNAPCVSLRTNKDTPEDIIDLAAKAILSGGAHPIFLNDEKIINGLRESGNDIGRKMLSEKYNGSNIEEWNSKVSLKSAKNYACDGCYEPQFPAENWFSLGGFSALQPLECALNEGKIYSFSGESYLAGKRVSLRTKHVREIENYDQLEKLYFEHFDYQNRLNLMNQLRSYGANSAFCPSPLLNYLMVDCMKKGQDFYSGGTKYNIYAPCYVGITSVVNSLYAIKQLVFDEQNAITTLEELLICLSCNWGEDLKEPFISQLGGAGRKASIISRFRRLRSAALKLPKFGRIIKENEDSNTKMIEFGEKLMVDLSNTAVKAYTEPWPEMYDLIVNKTNEFGTKTFPFGIQFQPGVGTFENYHEMGSWNGASADGRLSGTAFESDISPTPWPKDKGENFQRSNLIDTLSSYGRNNEDKGIGTVFSDGAPTDLRIEENFSLSGLKSAIYAFINGYGSNILTISTANVNVMKEAVNNPEKFDLLRVRTGGWSNFFVSMFPTSQIQQIQRPIEDDNFKGDISKCPFHQGLLNKN